MCNACSFKNNIIFRNYDADLLARSKYQFFCSFLQFSKFCKHRDFIVDNTVFTRGKKFRTLIRCIEREWMFHPNKILVMSHTLAEGILNEAFAQGEMSFDEIIVTGCTGSFRFDTTPVIAQEIKDTMMYITLDYDQEVSAASSTLEKAYTLPDGKVITVCDERFRCPEVLFRPSLFGIDDMGDLGFQKTIFKSIMMCDSEIRTDLLGSIVLCDGNTMYPWVQERMQKASLALDSESEAKVIAPPYRQHLAWKGGSVMASVAPATSCWISKEEYDEIGPIMVWSKCFWMALMTSCYGKASRITCRLERKPPVTGEFPHKEQIKPREENV